MALVDRIKGILVTPRQEWPVIEAEPATTGSLYAGYIIPLAAIPAIAGLIGMSVFGATAFGVTVRIPFSTGLTGAVVRYVLSLVGGWVLAIIIDALAPSFGGTKSPIQALKVAAYASTASWLAGIFMLIPALGILTLLGLYSLYLLFLGLPVLMKSPPEKSMGYTVVVIICAVVLSLCIGAIASQVMRI